MVKNMFKNLKSGYSLMEVVVVMVVVAIFVALMANVVVHKPKQKQAAEAHGRYECYYDGNKLYEQLIIENTIEKRSPAKVHSFKDASGVTHNEAACEFEPPSWAKYMVVDAVGGGAGGSSSAPGGEGQFSSTFFASVHRKYLAVPGKGGSSGNPGGDTLVLGNGTPLITARGGTSRNSIDNATINDIVSCNVTKYTSNEMYDCKTIPNCEVKDGLIVVNYCRSPENYKEVRLNFDEYDVHGNLIKNNPRNIKNNVELNGGRKITELKNTPDKDTWIYHDITLWSDYSEAKNPVTDKNWKPDVDADVYRPSLYQLEIKMNLSPITSGKAASNLATFMTSMRYGQDKETGKTFMGVKEVGNGGIQTGGGSSGNHGGVLFLW